MSSIALRSVRAKLAALVLLAVVPTAIALPLAYVSLRGELHAEVSTRLHAAEGAFQTELDDDISDLALAARLVAADPIVSAAVTANHPDGVREALEAFATAYPGTRLYVLRPDGSVLSCSDSIVTGRDGSATDVPELAPLLRGGAFRGVIRPLCADENTSALQYGIGSTIAGTHGAVLVCFALDARYLENTRQKLGMQLALHLGTRRIAASPDFPEGLEGVVPRGVRAVDLQGRRWALTGFAPSALRTSTGPLGVVAAVDVTDLYAAIERQFALAFAVIVAAASLSLWVGYRLADRMSQAIHRICEAMGTLQNRQYVRVEGLRTGDELEDLATAFNGMVSGLEERDKLRDAFSKYHSRRIGEEILAGKVALGGEDVRATVLFCDLRGFTSISERMSPRELVALLNEYFGVMVGAITSNEGVVDKFVGDAIMAVWGAPVPEPGDALNACKAALAMRTRLAKLNESLVERGITPLRVGIGVHTGHVVVGNIGSNERMEYTVIGDTVNLASRLESMTKDLGCDVLLSDDTRIAAGDTVEVKELHRIHVRGRDQEVLVYSLVGLRTTD